MPREKSKYVYNGAVMHFDRVVANNVSLTTMAVSEKQAANNILFQLKRKWKFSPDAKLKLVGQVREVSS